MNVLAIFHLGDQSGPSRSLDMELCQLTEGGRLHVLAPADGTLVNDYRRFAEVTVLPYAILTKPHGLIGGLSQARRFVRDVRLIASHIRRTSPDLVVVVTSMIPAALLAARWTRRPVIAYVSEILHGAAAAGRRSVVRTLLAHYTALLADVLVCSSSSVSAQFERVARGRVVTTYPRIDHSYARGNRAASRALWGVAEEDFCLAVVGALSHGRGQDLAIRALAELRGRLPRARLLIAGAPHPRAIDRRYQSHLRDLVTELGLESNVRFLGYVNDVADVYAAADVVINPARVDEAFGRVAAEAMIAGRPVVATEVGAVPEVFRNNIEALLVRRDDAQGLAHAVARLATDASSGEPLVAAGRRRVDELCSADRSLLTFNAAAAMALDH